MGNNPKPWHRKVIPEAAERVLEILCKSNLDSFYLGGGTGLALQLGHRISRDLDMFSEESFSEELLLDKLKDSEKVSVISKDRETLHLHILDIKVSFLGYHYPSLFPFESFMGI
ncbi:MAG: nucleotidyl transferase AbiEii/AbiGii toxin family protein [Acidobacteria bacterium]|nr:nucleotidyl transferase AbiEii/AbiGii toxin family protein [Acidobacteriota bacterium]